MSNRRGSAAAARLKASIVLKSLCHDAARRFGLVSGQIGENTGGPTRKLAELERSADVFDAYIRYGGACAGLRILEIGTGDNLLVPLRFVAAGAAQVACLDRFLPLRNTPFHRDLYGRFRERLSPDELRNVDAEADLSNGVKLSGGKIRHYH